MNARGFTLIEILVALLVLGVMAAVAAPAFLSERTPPDMVEAEGRIDALFRMARDSAVRTARPVTVVVDSASSLVWLDVRAPLEAHLPESMYLDPDAPGGDPGGSGRPTASGRATSGTTTNPGTTSGTATSRPTTSGSFGGGSTLGRGTGRPGAGVPSQGESLELPASVRLELFSARGLFTFLPSGAAQGDSLVLRSADGGVRLVTLDPWTGRVRVR